MSRIDEIRAMPDTVPIKGDSRCTGIHESTLKGYAILQLVKMMLGRGDSVETISMVISECEVKDG